MKKAANDSKSVVACPNNELTGCECAACKESDDVIKKAKTQKEAATEGLKRFVGMKADEIIEADAKKFREKLAIKDFDDARKRAKIQEKVEKSFERTWGAEINQEEIEMMRAYGHAEADGEFADDAGTGSYSKAMTGTDIVPWVDPNVDANDRPIIDWSKLEDEDLDKTPIPLLDKWRVIIEPDHNLVYPDLNLHVWVNGLLHEEVEFAEMLARSGCHRASVLDEADLCIFTGGADVDPAYYGHPKWSTTQTNPTKDASDVEVYTYCLSAGVPMFGVCRGAQFLHVANGGELYQDVGGHVGDHPIADVIAHTRIDKTPSLHHQLCMPNPKGKMTVIATHANTSDNRRFWSKKDEDFINHVGVRADIEAFFYRDTCCLGVQGHPEWSLYPEYTVWCMQQIEKWIYHCPDVEWAGSVLRIKEDIRKQREQGFGKAASN